MIAFFSTFFSTLAAWLISLIGRKATIFTVSLVAYVSATGVFLVAIQSLVSGILNAQILPGWISSSIGMFLPYSFTFDLSAMIGAFAFRWAYDIVIAKVSLINSAT